MAAIILCDSLTIRFILVYYWYDLAVLCQYDGNNHYIFHVVPSYNESNSILEVQSYQIIAMLQNRR